MKIVNKVNELVKVVQKYVKVKTYHNGSTLKNFGVTIIPTIGIRHFIGTTINYLDIAIVILFWEIMVTIQYNMKNHGNTVNRSD